MNAHRPRFSMKARRQRGISIVESLVALVVIAVGMLGIAGLYLSSLQSSRSAKLRSQAVQLGSSLADRIRSNREGAVFYATAGYGAGPAAQDCQTKICTPQQLAQDDLANWIADIREALPGADRVTGTVVVTDRERPESDNYVISVTWREANSDIDYAYTFSMNLENEPL